MAPQIDELYGRALIFLEQWKLDEAEEVLRQVLDLDKEHVEALNKLGVIFARREDLKQAEDYFNEALALDPNLASAHSNLGNIYAERGWTDRAKTAYERALFLDPGNPTATHNLGVLYRKSGEIGKGVDLLKQAYKSDRHRKRQKANASPESKRVMRIGWTIIAIIALVLFYFLNR